MPLAFVALVTPSAVVQQRGPTEAQQQAKVVALAAVSSLYFQPDDKKFVSLLDDNAAWKTHGPGSARKLLPEQIQDLADGFAARILVKEIHFFTSDNLADYQQRFANLEMWNNDRLPAHMGNGLACLIVWRHLSGTRELQERAQPLVIVIKQVGNEYKITYVDDPP
jgi:hypothetical protein